MTLSPALLLLVLLPLAQDRREPAADDAAALRAQGQPALERLLQRYDDLAAGPAREALGRTIDAVAAQRYATVSRLYWYTDLDSARAAAHATGKPILSLRMLGRLDEELACANARFFRVVLYADPGVSSFLRESFVLHWSSERPVPRLTVDFGDGRRIETTIAGNSAHYVLDADGHPIDVLPGLYSPVAFRRELEAILPLARSSPGLAQADRLTFVREHHVERLRAAAELWENAAREPVAVGIRSGLLEAEQRSATKAAVELPTIVAGRLVGTNESVLFPARLEEARLSGASRALLARLGPIDWGRPSGTLAGSDLDRAVATLEALVAVDTERNELQLRGSVHRWYASFAVLPDFPALNDLVYRQVFGTPRDDPWLGLAGRGMVAALPRDGLVE